MRSTSSTGFQRVKRGSAIFTKGFWRRMRPRRNPVGQYFTPRPLIDCIVRLMQPQPGEVVQDPAAGTGGFLVAADHYIKERTDDLFKLPKEQIHFQKHNAFVGLELVPDAHRLRLMNLMLHGIEECVE